MDISNGTRMNWLMKKTGYKKSRETVPLRSANMDLNIAYEQPQSASIQFVGTNKRTKLEISGSTSNFKHIVTVSHNEVPMYQEHWSFNTENFMRGDDRP